MLLNYTYMSMFTMRLGIILVATPMLLRIVRVCEFIVFVICSFLASSIDHFDCLVIKRRSELGSKSLQSETMRIKDENGT